MQIWGCLLFFPLQFFCLSLTRAYLLPYPQVTLLCWSAISASIPGLETPCPPPSSCPSLPSFPPQLLRLGSLLSVLSLHLGRGSPWMLGVKWCRSIEAEESPGFSTSLFPHPHPSRRGPIWTDPTPYFLFAGKLWVTAPAGDFAIRPLGPGEEEPQAPHPLPLHHFGYPADTDFQEGRLPPLTPSRVATCLCRTDPSPMTLRCLEPSGNGAEGTQSQWGTAGSAEEPSPEAARLAKALRELSQTGREPISLHACERGVSPKTRLQALPAGSAAWKRGRDGGKEWDGTRAPRFPFPLRVKGSAERMHATPWVLGNAKEKWFSRDSEA